jgi:hypothetical protein
MLDSDHIITVAGLQPGQILLVMIPILAVITGWFIKRILGKLDEAAADRQASVKRHITANADQLNVFINKQDARYNEVFKLVNDTHDKTVGLYVVLAERTARIEGHLGIYIDEGRRHTDGTATG